MISGNEYEHSLWFYGGYRSSYPGTWASGVDVALLYIATSGVVIFFSMTLLLKVVVTFHGEGAGTARLEFTQKVFMGFDHSQHTESGVQLEQSSMAVDLHESLLEHLDEEEHAVMTPARLKKRIIGIFLCFCVGAGGSLAIGLLVMGEKDSIIPWIAKQSEAGVTGMGTLLRFSEYMVPVGVALLKFITPFLVRKIVMFGMLRDDD